MTTGGAEPPALAAYDVANTDFLADLAAATCRARPGDFTKLDPARIASGRQSLDGFGSIVLADEPFPGGGDEAGYYGRLREWVRKGGNLVLTDGALRALPRVTGVPAGLVANRKLYVEQDRVRPLGGRADARQPLVSSPNDVRQDGARFNSSNRRQTYEPTPLGFAIRTRTRARATSAPTPRSRPRRTSRTPSAPAARCWPARSSPAPAARTRSTRGRRWARSRGHGAGAFPRRASPAATEAFDHDFGIEPYAVTPGWILFCNLLGAECKPQAATAGATACPATAGASPRPRRRRAGARSMGFTRRLGRRVNVDVFQVSMAAEVLKERLIARFKEPARVHVEERARNRRHIFRAVPDALRHPAHGAAALQGRFTRRPPGSTAAPPAARSSRSSSSARCSAGGAASRCGCSAQAPRG